MRKAENNNLFDITGELVRDVFIYDSESNVLLWRKGRKGTKGSNGVAGNIRHGWRRIVYKGVSYDASSLISQYFKESVYEPMAINVGKTKSNSIIINVAKWVVSVMTAKIKVKIYLER